MINLNCLEHSRPASVGVTSDLVLPRSPHACHLLSVYNCMRTCLVSVVCGSLSTTLFVRITRVARDTTNYGSVGARACRSTEVYRGYLHYEQVLRRVSVNSSLIDSRSERPVCVCQYMNELGLALTTHDSRDVIPLAYYKTP